MAYATHITELREFLETASIEKIHAMRIYLRVYIPIPDEDANKSNLSF